MMLTFITAWHAAPVKNVNILFSLNDKNKYFSLLSFSLLKKGGRTKNTNLKYSTIIGWLRESPSLINTTEELLWITTASKYELLLFKCIFSNKDLDSLVCLCSWLMVCSLTSTLSFLINQRFLPQQSHKALWASTWWQWQGKTPF